jgi:TPR repeat protein
MDFANQEEGIKWFHEIAKTAQAEVAYKNALRYFKGEDVPKNDVEAVRKLRQSAGYGYPQALFLLGKCHYEGKGVEQNIEEAMKLLQQAAAKGVEEAMEFLDDIESGRR